MEGQASTLLVLTPYEARTAVALFERLFPSDENGPGAIGIGVLAYLDRALAGAYRDKAEAYRLGLAALDLAASRRNGVPFSDCSAEKQDALLAELERGVLPDFRIPPQGDFFEMLRAHLQEGLFADPAYGGNRDKLGWKLLGHPGIWFENSAEENLSEEPVTKGGRIQPLEDVGYALEGSLRPRSDLALLRNQQLTRARYASVDQARR
jgi:gluconate 2-dehydrogenase alpha chain